MYRVHGSDRAPPYSLAPDRTLSRNYYPVPLQCYDPCDACTTRVVHHHSSTARRCTASGGWGGRCPIRGHVPCVQPPPASTPLSSTPVWSSDVLFVQKPVRQSASRQVASRRAKAHTGGRRSVATERVQGCSTPSSNRPPQSHLPVPMPARRASPRVHDHDDGDDLKTGSVLGVGGNILGIGLSHEDRGEIRTHTQHPGIGTRAKVRHRC
jgi:hypothetical protein